MLPVHNRPGGGGEHTRLPPLTSCMATSTHLCPPPKGHTHAPAAAAQALPLPLQLHVPAAATGSVWSSLRPRAPAPWLVPLQGLQAPDGQGERKRSHASDAFAAAAGGGGGAGSSRARKQRRKMRPHVANNDRNVGSGASSSGFQGGDRSGDEEAHYHQAPSPRSVMLPAPSG